MLIDIVTYDGLDEIDALGPLEALHSADRLGAEVTARLVTRQPQAEVVGAFGLRFAPDGTYEPALPTSSSSPEAAGPPAPTSPPGRVPAQRLALAPRERAATTAAMMAGVCTGTMLLAHAGIVGARRATTHHTAWSELLSTSAQLVKEQVVDDGNLVTSGGVTSGSTSPSDRPSESARRSSLSSSASGWSTPGPD